MLTYKDKLLTFSVSFVCAVLYIAIWNYFPRNINIILTNQISRNTSAKCGSVIFKHSSVENDSTIFERRNYKLVDGQQVFSDTGEGYNTSDDRNTSDILQILWYNKPSWYGYNEELCHANINKCFHGNCLVTYNRSLLGESDAVIFDASEPSFPENLPLTSPERDASQVWIFFSLESPFHYYNAHFRRSEWRSVFNWTMTYRLDSEIQHPYGVLSFNHNPPVRDYRAIFRAKKKFAAWIVSHCDVVSKRDEFVRLLQKYIDVDIFGRCGTKNCTKEGSECKDNVGKEYKFYLSFENSLCKDYITEKFFEYFPLDLVTVQRGYADYDSFLPNDTYINTAKFSTIQDLANFMKCLSEDEDQYIRYLKSKDRYLTKSLFWVYCNALCDICDKINNLEKYKKSYNDIVTWLENNTCVTANDIK